MNLQQLCKLIDNAGISYGVEVVEPVGHQYTHSYSRHAHAWYRLDNNQSVMLIDLTEEKIKRIDELFVDFYVNR